ncbi:hypothetical protein DIURU_000336 [Diutina rugosa]|uniref:Uncharacterized protein n=1 Tax=Diutina rugosa TaxID=5481 RepID=A0A642UYN7_DIURU|nr:uncharacterized protein DIURU_000336 [Diutina rugosa]KAA8907926.1 hypothetical protein DIURU_000336 [Diutina rugosa]
MINRVIDLQQRYNRQAELTVETHQEILRRLVLRHQHRVEIATRIGVPTKVLDGMSGEFDKVVESLINYFANEIAQYHRLYHMDMDRHMARKLMKKPVVMSPSGYKTNEDQRVMQTPQNFTMEVLSREAKVFVSEFLVITLSIMCMAMVIRWGSVIPDLVASHLIFQAPFPLSIVELSNLTTAFVRA